MKGYFPSKILFFILTTVILDVHGVFSAGKELITSWDNISPINYMPNHQPVSAAKIAMLLRSAHNRSVS